MVLNQHITGIELKIYLLKCFQKTRFIHLYERISPNEFMNTCYHGYSFRFKTVNRGIFECFIRKSSCVYFCDKIKQLNVHKLFIVIFDTDRW